MNNEQEFLNLIIRSAVKSERISCQPQVDWGKLFNLAHKHSLLVLTYATLYSNGFSQAEKLKKSVYKLILKANSLEEDIIFVIKKLSDSGIKCLPIKGYNIRDEYPSKDMRYLLDFDCLVEEKNLKAIKNLLIKEGYTFGGRTIRHLEMYSPKGNLIEFHTQLFDRFLDDSFAKKVLAACEQKPTVEQEYIISVAHLASHFVSGGVGVRNVIDLYLLKNKITDTEWVENSLNKYGLKKFGQEFDVLGKILFEGQPATEWSRELLDYVYESDYLGGNDKQELFATAVNYKGDLKKARKSSVWRKIFPTFSDMRGVYPSLKKCPVLLPFYYIKRFFTVLTKRRKSLNKINKISSYTEQEVIKVNKILTNLGLIK